MTVEKANGETVEEGIRRNSRMSLTYSDFIYPQVADVDLDLGTLAEALSNSLRGSTGNLSSASSYLPNEFQVIQETPVPLLQNLEEADHDFIIIAEFSELEGPIPICTIPSTTPEKTDINLNSFAVHLMSTDYQVNTVGQFGICEDTQVLRTNVFKGVHVFMQYFTLYDIKARGFVRPFCFGYVTKDHIKLDRIVKSLIDQFNEITCVLKYTNRAWFASELTQYLSKLIKAKEEFIFKSSSNDINDEPETDVGFMFEANEIEEDSEFVTLNQIAQQYTEIENILKIIKDSMAVSNANKVNSRLEILSIDSSKLNALIQRLDFLGDFFSSLNIPLVHPLKQKGESLRPLTSLGQLGTVALAQDLMMILEQNNRDLLFTEFDSLTMDFRNHFQSGESDRRKSSISISMFVMTEQREDELCLGIEKIHTSVPIVEIENKSGSYHSLSTEESDISTPKLMNGEEEVASSFQTGFGSVENGFSSKRSRVGESLGSSSFSTTIGSPPTQQELRDFLCHTDMNSSWTIIEPLHPVESGSSEDDSSPRHLQRNSTENTIPIDIKKVPWWTYAAKTKLGKGDPGYGLRKFWIHFPKVAHHVIFSILIGRPIIFFGSSKFRSRVNQAIYALLPLIPSLDSFKILPWHQGILVGSHIDGSIKLIGLCIPERLDIHDLLNPKDQNSVTLLDIEKKKILGPAYCGTYFKNFEISNYVQKSFFDDLSLLCYFGSILSDVEAQVYMYKIMQGEVDISVSKIMKELGLKNSDTEIIKYLSNTIKDPENSVDLF